MKIFFAIAPFFLLGSVNARACDDDWASVNGACLKVVTGSATESEAHDACDTLGGARLASIHNHEEHEAVLSLISEADPSPASASEYLFRIGLKLTRRADDGKLISCSWTDGSVFEFAECKEQSGRYPWATLAGDPNPEPNNAAGKETCVMVNKGGWIDDKCDIGTNRGYICKK